MKLPTGGRLLLTQREQGMHPPRVWVICGSDRARKPRNAPCLFVAPDDQPAKMDWSLVTGVPVHIVARDGYHDQVLSLVVAVAVHAEPVVIHLRAGADEWPYAQGQSYHVDASDILFGERIQGEWPPGWNGVLDQDYARRKWDYLAALMSGLLLEGGIDESERGRCARS